MRKVLLTMVILLILSGCTPNFYGDEPWVITGKELSGGDYKYKYTIECMYMGEDSISKRKGKLSYFSDHNYSVGDTLWIGARWGSNNKKEL